MKKIMFGAAPALFAVFAVCASAQTVPPKPPAPPPVVTNAQPVSPCPQIQLRTPTQLVREGAQIGFGVTLTGGDSTVTPIFSWSISAGMVVGGQGTRNIGVDSTGAGADRQIIADLLVGGYPPECTNQATATVAVAGPAKKLDEYGDIAEKDETERLDRFISGLSPLQDQAYVFAYAGRTNPRGYAVAALKRIKAYLVKAGYPSERIAMFDGGFREQPSYELWVVPIGAEAPRPSPTVDRKEIVFPKTTPAKKP